MRVTGGCDRDMGGVSNSQVLRDRCNNLLMKKYVLLLLSSTIVFFHYDTQDFYIHHPQACVCQKNVQTINGLGRV